MRTIKSTKLVEFGFSSTQGEHYVLTRVDLPDYLEFLPATRYIFQIGPKLSWWRHFWIKVLLKVDWCDYGVEKREMNDE